MTYPLTEIEELCKEQTERELGNALWASYIIAREKLFKDLLPFIHGRESSLTDHGPDHIIEVLNNCYQLLGKKQCVGKNDASLNAAELYFLVLSCLFHDVGNVFSRKGHKDKLSEAYEYSKGTSVELAAERFSLFRIVGAHGGKTNLGSSNTIGPLEPALFKGKKIDLQRVASILRFADELAEGPQRTSLFMQQYLPYPPDSQIYHEYANITTIHISRNDERIVISYHIEIAPETNGGIYDREKIQKLLEFCYYRIYKLDAERRYTKHYCSLLTPFKKTEVSFHFTHLRDDISITFPKLTLDDLVLPDVPEKIDLSKTHPDHDLQVLMDKLDKALLQCKGKERAPAAA